MNDDNGIFLRNCWYVAAWDHELLHGAKLARTILEKPVVLFRGESGRYIALDNRCCHRGAPLSMGRVEGDCIRCMYHGMKYDASGVCVQIPGQSRIPESLRVTSYPVQERGHLVWIWLGDPARADPALIVDYPPLHDPAWRGVPAYLHYDANWLLIVDNLSDFAHLAFVHTNTLGGSEEYAYTTKPTAIERLENGFRVERWHRDSLPPPYHRKVIPPGEYETNVDRRNIATMLVPGIFLMETMFAPAGSGAENGNLQGVRQYRNSQYMTPETRRTTHFFWNYLHNVDIDNPDIAISLRDSLIEGFMEDKAIIESQQVLLDNDPGFKLRALEADVALTHFRVTLRKRIREENEAGSVTHFAGQAV
ncbi:MAG: LysR family transcriptional regulator [Gammaproteobacteria bacterium RIFCSPLOWO2_02_FULL_61_13]|nr:MAG: LysR family transcriptional regulator [Gammaproteobacteria bacterium RIFCSPLOWO2_02_FULL_61_13]